MAETSSTLTAILALRDNLSSSLAKPMAALQKMGFSFQTVAAAATKAGVIMQGALILMSKSAIDVADQLDKLSKQTGISTTDLQKFGLAAQAAGSDLQDVAIGLRILSRDANEAAAGTVSARAKFEALGISVKDTNGNLKTAQQLFNELADVIKNTASPTERMAIASDLLGRSGAQLIPLLEQGADGMRKMGDAADKAGFIMSENTVKTLDTFGDQLGTLKTAFTAMTGNMLAQTGVTVPKIVGMFTTFAMVINELKERAVAGFKVIGNAMEFLWSVTKSVFGAIGEFIAISFAKAITPVIKMLGALATAMDKLGFEDKAKSLRDSLAPFQELASRDLSKPFVEAGSEISAAYDKLGADNDRVMDQMHASIKDNDELLLKFKNDLQGVITAQGSAAAKANETTQKTTELANQEKKSYADRKPAAEDAAKLEEEAKKRLLELNKQVRDFEQETGIKLTAEHMAMLSDEAKRADGNVGKLLEKIQKATEANPLSGFALAMRDLAEQTFNFRDAFKGIFETMQHGTSDAFANMIANGDKLSDGMKRVFNDIKMSFIKMLTDMLTTSLFKQLAGLLMGGGAGAPGAGGAGGAGGLGGIFAGALQAGGSGLSAGRTAGAGGAAAAGAGGFSLGGAGLAAGGLAGMAIMSQQSQQGNMLGSVAGGALMGATTGAAFGGPFGALIGLGAGSLVGGFMGAEGKDADEKAKAAAAEAEAAAKKARKKLAKQLADAGEAGAILSPERFETQLKENLGGGVATPEAAKAIGEILSGGVSAAEVQKFQQGDYKALTGIQALGTAVTPPKGGPTAETGKVAVNNPTFTINASISSSYDVNKLASDLVAAMQNVSTQSVAVAT